MKHLCPDDRPREKLRRHGAAALGDNELVALVLGNGGPRDNALGLVGLFGPDDRGPVAGSVALERQNRKRSRGQKVFLRAAVMVALMAHGRRDARLAVLPAVCRDAGTLAD